MAHCNNSFAQPKIIECNSITEVTPFIDQDTWLLLDLDNTVFQSSEPYGHVDWFIDEVECLMKSGLSKEEAVYSMFPKWKHSQNGLKVIPVESELIDYLKLIQKNKVTAFAITSRESFLSASTMAHLNTLDIDFRLTAPINNSISFTSNEDVLYQNGVLFVHTFNSKGIVFREFLKLIERKPKKIVFIDDSLKNVHQMAEMAKAENIEYYGFHYTAIDNGPKIYSREKLFSSLRENVNPTFLYTTISLEKWKEALHEDYLDISLHSILSLEELRLSLKPTENEDYVVLKLSLSEIPSEFNLIPLNKIDEVRINRLF